MFTGIIENLGVIKAIASEQKNKIFTVSSPVSSYLTVDQSIAHDGVCLTVIEVVADCHKVLAIDETLRKSNLDGWDVGRKVNLERCMPANGRFDGHIVQGHVDQVGRVVDIQNQEGSWVFRIEYDAGLGHLTVEKGSVTVNGTSLTCFESAVGTFSVAIIPYTYDNTVFHQLTTGDLVNLEFDIIGKYVRSLVGN